MLEKISAPFNTWISSVRHLEFLDYSFQIGNLAWGTITNPEVELIAGLYLWSHHNDS
ncbi:MAG: hypothetical protein ACFFEF_12230 [Candidatus Thorarchaeota archaeon]